MPGSSWTYHCQLSPRATTRVSRLLRQERFDHRRSHAISCNTYSSTNRTQERLRCKFGRLRSISQLFSIRRETASCAGCSSPARGSRGLCSAARPSVEDQLAPSKFASFSRFLATAALRAAVCSHGGSSGHMAEQDWSNQWNPGHRDLGRRGSQGCQDACESWGT